MKKLFLLSLLFISSFSFAQIVTYDVPITDFTGVVLNSGDWCIDPGEYKQSAAGNTWGLSWTSTGGNVPSSVTIEMLFTVNDATGPHPTTLNGNANTPVNPPLVSCGAALNTYSVNPTNYTVGGLNTFLMTYAASSSQSLFAPVLAWGPGIYARVTVDYTPPCIAPDVPTVTHNPNPVCDGANTTLNIAGNLNSASKWYIYTGSCGGTIVDSTSSNSFVVTPTGPSTIYYIRGEGNCITPGACGMDSVYVLPALTGAVNNTICDGDSIVVNGTTYNSGNPTGTEVFTNVGPNNCDSTVTVNLTVNPLPTVTMAAFSPDTICSTTPAFALPAGTPALGTYTGNGVSGTNFDPNTAGTGSHYVVYTFTDGNNCTSADSSMITVEICTGTNTVNTLSNINIYPNPTEGMVTIDLGKSAENMQINILSIDGKLIQQINNVNNKIIPINMASFSKGVYILKVNDATQQSIHRITKK